MTNTYPGGKLRLHQQLINLIPPHQTYIATHAGHDAIAQMKRPAETNILIDRDWAVMRWWQARLAADGAGAGGAAEASPVAMVASSAGGDGARRCASSRVEVTPAGVIVDAEQHWRILEADATLWLTARLPQFQGNEFVYVDPPYLADTRSAGRAYYAYEMLDTPAHERLLRQLVKLPCPVMVSHYHHPLYMDFLGAWHWRTFRAYDRAGNEKTEYVWMNYPEPKALHDYRFLGEDYRERERVKRKKARWVRMWREMPRLERLAILSAIQEANG